MDNEFLKKVSRESFDQLSQETQATILQCFDHQKWLETEQAKLEYIYSLAQLHTVYSKQKNGLAAIAEQKIQRAFQTLVLEGGANKPIIPSNGNGHVSQRSDNRNGNGRSSTSRPSKETKSKGSSSKGSNSNADLSFAEDLEFSLEGF